MQTQRQQAPDREGLRTYAQLLAALVKHAPGGFPNQSLLSDVWTTFNQAYNIRSASFPSAKSRRAWANECADAVRLATKRLVDLRGQAQASFRPPCAN